MSQNEAKDHTVENKKKVFFGLHARPGKTTVVVLTLVPFIIVICFYLIASDIRLSANPNDKLLPSFGKMLSAIYKAAFVENARSGELILWVDTFASLKRIFIGVGLASLFGLLMGINMGMFKNFKSAFAPFITVVSMIPPLAILPILFLTLGIGEVGKIALITIGTFPIITRDIYLSTAKLPVEQTVKALSLGASQYTVVYRIILPQIMPKLINTIRLTLGSAWLFLIAAEAIASTDGLGYRIFLLRRYLSMDLIIPYVLWITLIGFTVDFILKKFIQINYRWYDNQKG